MWNGILEDEKKSIIHTFNPVYGRYLLIAPLKKISKNPEVSKAARSEGNELFKKKSHDSKVHEIIHSAYTRSIANAPASSEELALAYGNRSAVLLHLSKFTECIEDIDRALGITKSSVLKTKLLCRKAKCLAAAGSKSEFEKILTEARRVCDTSGENDKKSLLKLIEEAENCSKNMKKTTAATEKNSKKPVQAFEFDKTLNDFSSVSIAHNDKYGNHLIAAKDIEAGEVIFVEKPYVFTVDTDKTLTHCDYCYKISWSSLPCNTCAKCMYCSEDCRREAWNEYHEIECAALLNCEFSHLDVFVEQIAMVTLRALILGVKESGGVEKLRNNLEKLDEKRGWILNNNIIFCCVLS